MRWSLARFGIPLAVAALTGCGAQQSLPPGPLEGRPALSPGHAAFRIAKGLSRHDLLYVSNANGTVSVYRYWQHTLVGVLTKFIKPLGECTDAAQDVYIVDYQRKNVDEYAHGGAKPRNVLSDSPYIPDGCGVAPSSGNLAVANSAYGYYSAGNIAIYPHGSGAPKILNGSFYNDKFTDCKYDDRGDLLATSLYGYLSFYTHFYYLPKNGTKLITMDLPAPGQSSGWEYVQGVGFDGRYWVVVSFDRIYRFTINVKATYVDTIQLSGGSGDVGQIAFYRNGPKALATQIVGGDSGSGNAVTYWKYPEGGNPIAQITKDLSNPLGVAISKGTQ